MPESLRHATLSKADVPNLQDIRTVFACGTKPALWGAHGERIPLPKSLSGILSQIVSELATGRTVSVLPAQKELTTSQAADLLGISRQFLVRLLDEESIPFHRSGTHRRIYLNDLLSYKQQRDARGVKLFKFRSLKVSPSRLDSVRREAFWKQFPGLVWSNSKASDAVMIRAALTRAKKDRLEAVGREFGLKRLRREWSILCHDKVTPLSSRHISFVSHLLDEIGKNLKHAPRINQPSLENPLVKA
jgi:excisionase family DNA binding protein